MINIILIDTDKITEAIENYILKEGCHPTYIIMNEATEKLLVAQECQKKAYSSYSYNGNNVSIFDGIPIATCNGLEDGEIEMVKKVIL